MRVAWALADTLIFQKHKQSGQKNSGHEAEMSSETYTVVSTMKNEGPYIIDWVAHYKALGFDQKLIP